VTHTAVGSPLATTSVASLLEDFSVEVTAKDGVKLAQAHDLLLPGTRISVTYLPGEAAEGRVETAELVRDMGFVPVPHISARRVPSSEELENFLRALEGRAGLDRAFVVAGDLAQPLGPYDDALAIIRSGLLAKHGIRRVGIAGYPEGHPDIPQERLWQALRDKSAALQDLGHEPIVTTQFAFDSERVLGWIEDVRALGLDSTLRIGVPGPASVRTLMRFAARCGVGTSAKVLKKYGLSITQLLTTAGPDRLVTDLAAGIGPQHGDIRVHFYPFGGVRATVLWARDFLASVN
jgi:methylenetetrahydrofolate reductase (NADPH)